MLCLPLGDGCQAVLDGKSVVGSPIQPRREAETQAIRTRSCSVSDTPCVRIVVASLSG